MTDSGAERAARSARKFAEGLYALLSLGDAAKLPNSFVAVVTEQAEAWKAAIIREETGTHWISVSEKLPTRTGYYLAYSRLANGVGYYDLIRVLKFFRRKFHFSTEELDWVADSGVSHWQPLPAAPDEGGTKCQHGQ